ncbi:hypothetical protein [Aulosira sp. FACHB-615]|uniref:hypothetical protein n=1 Tax=Aulosira sp. FACHB-615 TaxID=2692777 RepID=UPI001683418F|nr:hypothetical protein [Aulosira sp. FACHB-615]MBD2487095.1 hypothetical protein [Aulosira sp. FACHB-615]
MKIFVGLTATLLFSPLAAFAQNIPAGGKDYIQQRYDNLNQGGAVDLEGCVNHLSSPSDVESAFVKTMWVTFDPSLNGRTQWLESGCTKAWTATDISTINAGDQGGSLGSFYQGHYFAYKTDVNIGTQANPNIESRYHEGRVAVSAGIPSGTFRYKIERDTSTQNKWCNYLNNSANYCITLAGIGTGTVTNYLNYNFARYVTVGIESGNLQHSFINNTKASNIWFRNSSGTWGRIPSMSKADNMYTTRPWSSIYAPTVTNSSGQVVTPDTITFKNQ